MLEWLVVEDSFYNALCPILDEKKIAYEPDKLKETCNAFFQMVDFKKANGCLSNALQKILPLLMGGENKDFARIINHHYSEVIYASLLEYKDS